MSRSAAFRCVACVALINLLLGGAELPREPHSFFKEQIGLTPQQIAAIDQGKIVIKALPAQAPAEVFIFGAVFVKAKPEAYAKLAFDLDRLRRSNSYIAVGLISKSPQLSDLEGFTLEPEDLRGLRSCRPGKCAIQLPEDAIVALQKAANKPEPDATAEVNLQVKRMAIDILRRYQKEGNRGIPSYRDKDNPFEVDSQLRSLLGQPSALPDYYPDLKRYLLDYPRVDLPNVESFYFWEKVSFGLKPTIRLNHAIAYKATGSKASGYIVIVKQIYASHYLQLALDSTACISGHSSTGEPGFYLVTLKGSVQQGLTGFFGAIARAIIVSKSRSAQERILLNIKTSLEAKP